MITDKEIQGFWNFFWPLMRKWFGRSFLAFISTAVIWDFISKNYLGSKKWYSSMNDTPDGDFGNEEWLEEKGLKKSWYSAFRWWFRNHSWNYISQYNPEWKAGEVDLTEEGQEMFLILSNTTGKLIEDLPDGIFTWLTRDMKIEGELYVAYRINGKVYCRYSKVWKDWFGRWRQYQKGAGGERYRLNRKPIL